MSIFWLIIYVWLGLCAFFLVVFSSIMWVRYPEFRELFKKESNVQE